MPGSTSSVTSEISSCLLCVAVVGASLQLIDGAFFLASSSLSLRLHRMHNVVNAAAAINRITNNSFMALSRLNAVDQSTAGVCIKEVG